MPWAESGLQGHAASPPGWGTEELPWAGSSLQRRRCHHGLGGRGSCRGQEAACGDDAAAPWAGGTGQLLWVASGMRGRGCRPLGWGDGELPATWVRLLVPHPWCRRRRLCVSASVSAAVRWPWRCPTGVSLGGEDRALPAAPPASCPPAWGRGAWPTGGPTSLSCPGMPLGVGAVTPSRRRAHSRLWPFGRWHPHLQFHLCTNRRGSAQPTAAEPSPTAPAQSASMTGHGPAWGRRASSLGGAEAA